MDGKHWLARSTTWGILAAAIGGALTQIPETGETLVTFGKILAYSGGLLAANGIRNAQARPSAEN